MVGIITDLRLARFLVVPTAEAKLKGWRGFTLFCGVLVKWLMYEGSVMKVLVISG